MAISKIYFMEFFETKSSFKEFFTAFEEIYLIEYSMEMQKSSTWSSSMVLSFKDSMANSKSYLMEYSIIMQRKRLMEFFKKSVLPQEVLHWYV